ncbi:endolytic transglycosylase MltG [Pectinatus sottacetonis]|uniref:endolytic transglycosylase MltG n=1 Tax=Pectinatus sottacetonis TaxID=1002795 RepID=UPI0018C6F008|nr:endolytic transglycosylase MltG [Pectinatus sottacetonis]
MSTVLHSLIGSLKKCVLYIKENRLFGIPLKYIMCVFLLFIVAIIIGFHSVYDKKAASTVVIEIKPGMQTVQIASLLKDKGIIYHDIYFRVLANIEGLDKELKVGRYVLHKNMTDSEVMQLLISGPRVSIVKITIPEGYTVEQIADLLAENGVVDRDKFLALAKTYVPYDYMKNSNPYIRYAVEGYLFPDTYEFRIDSSAKYVMDVMTGQFNRKFNETLRNRAGNLGLSVNSVVIMASLVEAEAKFNEDRPVIAQVFFNRLKINMPLQSDTTIQYALMHRKASISIKDTKMDSPYNTYKHYGLPPGPVDNPGLASLKAVLYPEKNDYLYFVADSSGHNHYSHTYQEHLNKIKNLN